MFINFASSFIYCIIDVWQLLQLTTLKFEVVIYDKVLRCELEVTFPEQGYANMKYGDTILKSNPQMKQIKCNVFLNFETSKTRKVL